MLFKNASWKWKKHFYVPNPMRFQVILMKIGGHYPIDFKKLLPNILSFLSTPLAFIYFAFWSFVGLHIATLFIVTLVMELRSNTATITEISNAFVQSIIYTFSFYTTAHFQWYHKDMQQIVDFMIKNFKMRSARGSFITFSKWCLRYFADLKRQFLI